MQLFSIITVVRNDLIGLQNTYESVASQQSVVYEWIVVDGGSTDGTVDYLQSLNCEVLTWRSEKDHGIYDAMNKGIRMCHGEYLVFMNAGDIFPNSTTLSLAAGSLYVHKNPDVLFGGVELAFANGGVIFRPPKKMERYIWHGLPANHQATYYKRKALGDVLYDPTYKICGDYYLIATLYIQGISAAYIYNSMVKFSVGGASYQNLIPLFYEPYKIQRDILGKCISIRLVSLVKRLISVLAVVSLQKLYKRKK